jgi:hypothetical protein
LGLGLGLAVGRLGLLRLDAQLQLRKVQPCARLAVAQPERAVAVLLGLGVRDRV